MVKQILQIENTESSEFIPKILKGFQDILNKQNNTSKDDEVLLTRESAAEMLSISLVTLWKYTKDDIIPAYRIGTKVRYKKSEILLALKQMNKF
ncbi:helix-turn-helix domain-containing protein [Mariniflexile sp. AS56]|uniref:helix-turn-helix domain-containing protein n=1 Tax=Mariniflexile sp. AS56 TaxID=3063957 RepID=UPI0026EE0FDB|nr:helix-turn-helix domain-containing protein [Mariniflexile sp. AS56]MDO7173453.1 helix-turn-helix domain-containing protein [Mariniflexile sp. AS56]